ncbi:MAG: hypothetical protein RIT81_47610, partial [Deltaproteobacteria bacterium]
MSRRTWMVWGVLASACAEPSPAPEGRVTTPIIGSVFFDGASVGEAIALYDFAEGVRGARLASGFTEDDGAFVLDAEIANGTLLVEADALSAIVDDVTLGAPRSQVRVTAATHLARIYAGTRVGQGDDPDEALQAARAAVHDWLGGVAHDRVAPIDVRAVAGVPASDGVIAGLVAAALVELGEGLRQQAGLDLGPEVTSGALLRQLSIDLSDGLFDGLDASGVQVRFAGIALDDQTLRAGLAAALIRFAEGPDNLSGVRGAEVGALAQAITTNDGPLFPAGTAMPVDAEPPRFVRAELRDRRGRLVVAGTDVAGVLERQVEAADDAGDVVEVLVEAGASRQRTPGGSGRFEVDTETLQDGARRVVITGVDRAGRRTARVFDFVVDNTAPRLSAEVPDSVPTATVAIFGEVEEASRVDVVIYVDGAPAARLQDAGATFEAIAPLPCGRVASLSVWAEDAAGNRSEASEHNVLCTATGPQITLQATRFVQEGDWAVDLEPSGALRYTAPAGGGRELVIDETAPQPFRFEKFLNRFDLASDNLPVFDLTFSPDVIAATYRYVVNGLERGAPRAIEIDADGRAAIPVAYATLGPELIARPGALHAVEVHARDAAGVTRPRTFTFEVDIRSPPVWYTDCNPSGRIGWANLGELFTENSTASAFEGQLAYHLELPSDTALDVASTPSVIARLTAPTLGSRVTALSEQTFVGSWSAPQTTAIWSMPCGIDVLNNRGYEVAEAWVTPPAPVCAIGPGLVFPDERVFWNADVRGPLSDTSAHPSVLEVQRNTGVRSVAARDERLVGDEAATLIVRLDAPRLSIGGAVYDWRTTYPPAPAGWVASVSTEGRYRWPGPEHHVGRELAYASSGPGVSARYRERPFETRASISEIEIFGPPVGVDVTPALGWSFLAVPLRRDDSCAAM